LLEAGLGVCLMGAQAGTGQEASWAGGGIVSPLYPWRYSDPVSELRKWSQGFIRSWAETLGSGGPA